MNRHYGPPERSVCDANDVTRMYTLALWSGASTSCCVCVFITNRKVSEHRPLHQCLPCVFTSVFPVHRRQRRSQTRQNGRRCSSRALRPRSCGRACSPPAAAATAPPPAAPAATACPGSSWACPSGTSWRSCGRRTRHWLQVGWL